MTSQPSASVLLTTLFGNQLTPWHLLRPQPPLLVPRGTPTPPAIHGFDHERWPCFLPSPWRDQDGRPTWQAAKNMLRRRKMHVCMCNHVYIICNTRQVGHIQYSWDKNSPRKIFRSKETSRVRLFEPFAIYPSLNTYLYIERESPLNI